MIFQCENKNPALSTGGGKFTASLREGRHGGQRQGQEGRMPSGPGSPVVRTTVAAGQQSPEGLATHLP